MVECKLLHRSLERTIREGVDQTLGYLDRCGAAAGHLVIFDRRGGRPWRERIFRREEKAAAGTVTVWGM